MSSAHTSAKPRAKGQTHQRGGRSLAESQSKEQDKTAQALWRRTARGQPAVGDGVCCQPPIEGMCQCGIDFSEPDC